MSPGLGVGKLEKELSAFEAPTAPVSKGPSTLAGLDDRSRLVFLTEPNGVAVEQYKILRHRLTSLHPRGGVVLVTSPGPGEGKTLTSANLAWCLAEGGHRTCLVDLDFRAPGLSQTLGLLTGQFGVEDVLSGERKVHQVLRPVGEFPFATLPVRRRRASPGSLLSAGAIVPLLEKLRSLHNWVLLDLAPALPMADIAELLPHVDGALLVIRCARSSRTLVTPTLDVLGSTLWGIVFNDAAISGSEYYGSYGKNRE